MDGALEQTEAGTRRHLLFRLTIGLLQGLAFAWLSHAEADKSWPYGELTFTLAVFVAVFWPPVLLVSIPLRRAAFALWSLSALGLIVALAYYGVWRNGDAANVWPDIALWPGLAALLFIAQALITAADSDRRFIASYTTYFETAWKLGLQAIMSAAFVALLWVVLRIGAELFLLIKLDFLKRLIENKWFYFPVSALAFAYAVDITDVRTGLIRGLRTLALMLQSWILPVMTLLAVAFLLALPFTGLEALWATKSATALLLSAAAVIVFLMNAAYRDGDGDVAALVRAAGTVGAIALVPLVGIASYALMLRIGQHGLTPDRVIAFYCAGIAVCFTMGYAISAINFGGWLKGLEATNVFAAFLILAVILALFTPLSDPARIAVNDQVARLSAGKIAADAFDYDFLRFKAGRYGRDALTRFASQGVGKEPDKVASLAGEALKRTAPLPAPAETPPTPAELAKQITVYPAGSTLPPSFAAQAWPQVIGYVPTCLIRHETCDAVMLDLDGDGTNEIAILETSVPVYKLSANGTWASIGELGVPFTCPGVANALKAGTFRLEAPSLKDIVTNEGTRIRVIPDCLAAN